MENKARGLFHGKEGYNCAQAVLATFKEEKNVNDEIIIEFKANGGGRAQDGYCGALYAAIYLSRDNEAAQSKLKDAFLEKAGALTCKGIKTTSKFPCSDCVALAAEMLKS